MSPSRINLPASTKKLIGLALGLGVVFVCTMAPFTGAKRIPYFQPLADALLEKHKSLLLPVSGILLSAIALTIHFYYGGKLSLKKLQRAFFVTLAVFLVSVGAFITLPRYVVKPGCLERPTVVGWSRLPGCVCGEDVPDAECYVRNVCQMAGCWSQGQVNAVESSIYASYLGSLCGFVALAGIVVLIEQARAQAKQRARERARKKAVTPAPPRSGPPDAPPRPPARNPPT